MKYVIVLVCALGLMGCQTTPEPEPEDYRILLTNLIEAIKGMERDRNNR